jgi:hypothetical protein
MPGDPGTQLELARAEVGTGRFGSARERLGALGDDPTVRELSDTTRRALAFGVETSGLARERLRQLDARGLRLRGWTPLIGGVRVRGEFEPVEFRDRAGSFRRDAFGVGVEWRGPSLVLGADGRIRDVEGLESTAWDLDGSARWRASEAIRLRVALSRRPIEETRRSVQGVLEAGLVRGAVQANLVEVGADLTDLPGPFDAWVTLLAGRYTGEGVSTNERLGVEADIGVLVRRGQPWVRLGYRFIGTRFDFNADTAVTPLPERRGGYFSPDEYWMSQGTVQLAHRFGSRVWWEVEGRLGAEGVRPVPGQTRDQRVAGGGSAHLRVRLTSGLDLDLRYLYLNAFDAFEMHEGRAALRLYGR